MKEEKAEFGDKTFFATSTRKTKAARLDCASAFLLVGAAGGLSPSYQKGREIYF